MNEQYFRSVLSSALSKVASERETLNIAKIAERPFCFRLGLALSSMLERSGYFIDSEYNIDLSKSKSKRVPNLDKLKELAEKIGRSQEEDLLVVPDFILHNRTENKKSNIIAIEVKWQSNTEKGKNEIDFASEKLKALKQEFEYDFCFLILLPRKWEDFGNMDNIIKLIS